MLAPLRRCVDGWPCMIGDLRGRRMRTGSKIENPSTTVDGESREKQLYLLNFSSNVQVVHQKVGHSPRHYPVRGLRRRCTAHARHTLGTR